MTNLTNISNIQSFYDLGKYAADSTGGNFWGIILVVLFIIVVVRLRLQEVENSVIAAGFVCFLISFLLMNLQMLQVVYPVVFAVITAGAVFYKIFRPQ